MQHQSTLQPITDFLRRHAPFKQMSQLHLDFLAKRLKLVFFAKDEIITGPDDGIASHLYIIKQGRVRGETPDGRTAEGGAWELVTGESFPVGALLAKRPAHTVQRAIEDTFVFELDREDFEGLLQKSAPFNDFCTRRIANLLDTAMREIRASTASDISGDSSLDTPLGSLLNPNPISCLPGTPIRQALKQIEESHRRSIAIVDEGNNPIGILTLRDVMVRVTLTEKNIDAPVSEVMTPINTYLSPEDFAYEAALHMAQSGVGHVCVMDSNKHFLGLVSERDLFSLQRVGLGNLSRSIMHADTLDALKQLSSDIQQLINQMMAQGASVQQLTQIISTLNDNITQRIIILVEAERGKPSTPFTWIAFGSEGRLEQTLKTDQDNGILFICQDGQSEDDARKELLPLAKRINESLDEVGFPLCPGNIMASNPECCLSLDEWKTRFGKWIESGTPDNLLKASIFFDFRALFGNEQPIEALRNWLLEKTTQNSLFRHMMAANSLRNRPPLGLFGDIKVSAHGEHKHSIDLKLQGITPFVDAARIIALKEKLPQTNTLHRLQAAADNGSIPKIDIEAWVNAYEFIQLLRMRNHHQQVENGEELHNFLEPDELNSLDRRILKEAFRQARKLQGKLELEYQLR
ncbi:MAG: CBS domain-containing protein [Gammaproteobacteria bacterium]|nr:CBS domain-containing protein [Gammaproteobacteria bacterium]